MRTKSTKGGHKNPPKVLCGRRRAFVLVVFVVLRRRRAVTRCSVAPSAAACCRSSLLPRHAAQGRRPGTTSTKHTRSRRGHRRPDFFCGLRRAFVLVVFFVLRRRRAVTRCSVAPSAAACCRSSFLPRHAGPTAWQDEHEAYEDHDERPLKTRFFCGRHRVFVSVVFFVLPRRRAVTPCSVARSAAASCRPSFLPRHAGRCPRPGTTSTKRTKTTTRAPEDQTSLWPSPCLRARRVLRAAPQARRDVVQSRDQRLPAAVPASCRVTPGGADGLARRARSTRRARREATRIPQKVLCGRRRAFVVVVFVVLRRRRAVTPCSVPLQRDADQRDADQRDANHRDAVRNLQPAASCILSAAHWNGHDLPPHARRSLPRL